MTDRMSEGVPGVGELAVDTATDHKGKVVRRIGSVVLMAALVGGHVWRTHADRVRPLTREETRAHVVTRRKTGRRTR
ncbi:hypothetical protein [Streptomyces sp. NPDC003077]|uniref:hypothetical protein n=1 Tax=Streptomyces sp. NPDC003077 TaxID=3154443 RepID=UPI0033B614C6